MINQEAIELRWKAVGAHLDERTRRLFAAAEVRAAGRGGLTAVLKVTGLSSSTIVRGLKDLDAPPPPAGRIRRAGGGRRPLAEHDPTLLDDLRRLVEPVALAPGDLPGAPSSRPLCADKLTAALRAMGHSISPNSVRKLLRQLGVLGDCSTQDRVERRDHNAQWAKIIATPRPRRQPATSYRRHDGGSGLGGDGLRFETAAQRRREDAPWGQAAD